MSAPRHQQTKAQDRKADSGPPLPGATCPRYAKRKASETIMKGLVGLGLALGAAIGAANGNVAVGVALGVVAGAVIGAAKTKRDGHKAHAPCTNGATEAATGWLSANGTSPGITIGEGRMAASPISDFSRVRFGGRLPMEDRMTARRHWLTLASSREADLQFPLFRLKRSSLLPASAGGIRRESTRYSRPCIHRWRSCDRVRNTLAASPCRTQHRAHPVVPILHT